MKNANSPPSPSSLDDAMEKENNVIPSELSDEAQLKLEVIQSLLEPCDRRTYGQRLREAAEKLGKSKRGVVQPRVTVLPNLNLSIGTFALMEAQL